MAKLPNSSMDQIWIEAALKTRSTGDYHLPQASMLKPLTVASKIWSDIDYHPEFILDRIGRMRDCHHLAIVIEDTEWLWCLQNCWIHAPPTIDELCILRAKGEIALGLGALGCPIEGWSSEDLYFLVEEAFLRLDAPSDLAWWLLGTQQAHKALPSILKYEALLSEVQKGWDEDSQDGMQQILTYPGSVLRVELKALLFLYHKFVE